MTRVEAILSQIHELSPPEFQELCERMEFYQMDWEAPALSPEEVAEIDRRIDEMRSGAVKGIVLRNSSHAWK